MGYLIVNPHSGAGDADALVATARERGIEVHVLGPGDDPAELARHADAEAIGVAGGDGSLAPVAAVAAERSIRFVCVPLGTRNHFARDLGLDRDDPVAALGAFSAGVERRVDLGFAGERPFLNNVSLGAYASLVRRRERHRRRRNAFARLRALATLLAHRPEALRVDGEAVDAHALLVASNAYDLDLLTLGERDRLDGGELHLYAAAGTFPSGWHERAATRFEVDTPRGHVAAAIDGEPATLPTPLAFTIVPRAVRVLLPPGVESAAREARWETTGEGHMESSEPTES